MSSPTDSQQALINRVKNILLTPKTEWPVVAGEGGTVSDLYTRYIMLLALVPAVAGFIGLSLVGIGGLGYSFRVPFVSGLVHAVVGYGLSLAMVYALAWVVNALAPNFGAQKDLFAAAKLVAYSLTAAWLGGIFSLLPSLAVLGVLAGLYSVYLLYLGLPVLMRCPPEKAVVYTVFTVICGFVLSMVIAAISALVIRGPGMSAGGPLGDAGLPGQGTISIKTPEGEVNIDQKKMEEWSRKMEEAGKRMEAAASAADGAAVAAAGAQMASAVSGAALALNGRAAMPLADLKAMLPESVAGLARKSLETQSGAAMGLGGSVADARYGSGDKTLALSIMDGGGVGAMASLAGALGVTAEKETEQSRERTYKEGDRTVHEEAQKDGSRAEYTLILASGVIVSAKGEGLDLAVVKQAVTALPLARLEAGTKP
ncbi:MAG TPA: Yip1 family protein [Ideonella sp.]|nr:Yip1 family protein [Ideonella sp.]